MHPTAISKFPVEMAVHSSIQLNHDYATYIYIFVFACVCVARVRE